MYLGRFKTHPNVEMCMWSRVLSRALHKLGANQRMRQRNYESCMLVSIKEKFNHITEIGTMQEHDLTIQFFGSQIEGTTTVGMRPDVDRIFISTNDVIEENIKKRHKIKTKIVVLVADMFTPPGYVKLKVYKTNLCMYVGLVKDEKGNCFLSNFYTDLLETVQAVHFPLKWLNKHGPALSSDASLIYDDLPTDTVIAVHCKSIPSFTHEFFSRRRRFSWPSMSTLNIMKDQGCLLVPTGHSECSPNQHILQWRVSFSFQERHLMLNLNSAQYLCYVLLKLVKMCFISPYVELTSYHCKTALFYTMENTPSEIWKEENLLYCFILCLNRLERWSKKHFCPNYFIQEINLFTGKIKEQDMYKLTDILSTIIDSPQYHIRLISIGNFGELLQQYELNSSKVGNIEFEIDTLVSELLQNLLFRASEALVTIKNVILQKILYNCNDINEIIDRHYKWLKSLKELDSVGGISLDGVTWGLTHVSRFLHSSLGSHLGIKASDTDNVILQSWYTVTAVYHLWMGLNSDSISGKMKLATMLLFTGYLNEKTLNWLWKAKALTDQICRCSIPDYYMPLNIGYKQLEDILQLNASQFLENYVSACTIFLPSERKLTLYPLQFEMFRSFGCERDNSLNIATDMSLYYCVTLDSNIYCILLRMYSSGNQKQLVEQLLECSTSDRYKHKETTLNILGWLASAEEPNSASLMFLKRSWDYQKQRQIERNKILSHVGENRNAAKWHMALLLYRAWRVRNREQPVKLSYPN